MARHFLRSLLVIALLIGTFALIGNQAAAQGPIANACCRYTIDVAGVGATCFPLRLTSRWSSGTQTDPVPGNGVFVYPVGAAPCPPVPAQFFWASLDAGVTLAWFNFPARYQVNGCCLWVRIGVDANGCIIVYIRPC
jgi:hypothetical protein